MLKLGLQSCSVPKSFRAELLQLAECLFARVLAQELGLKKHLDLSQISCSVRHWSESKAVSCQVITWAKSSVLNLSCRVEEVKHKMVETSATLLT